jgi:uncharacterized membrane protein
MFFFPLTFLIFILFILFLPLLFILVYFNILTLGFEKLGISPQATIFILFLILFGSFINIPLAKKKLVYVQEPYFFGFFRIPKIEIQGIFINLGGAIIPILLSFYFLFLGWKSGFKIGPILIATVLMIIISKFLAKTIPGKGVALSAFVPPIFSALFSLILAPKFAAPSAFISGVFGTLIGADLLNLRKARKYGGFISIGGAGVFDGIFLVGIVSALLVP